MSPTSIQPSIIHISSIILELTTNRNTVKDYIEANTLDDFKENYEITKDNIRTVLEDARLLREQINKYTNEEILKEETFFIESINYNTMARDYLGSPSEIKIFNTDGNNKNLKEHLLTTISSLSDHAQGMVDSAANFTNNNNENLKNIVENVSDVFVLKTVYGTETSQTINGLLEANELITSEDEQHLPDNITEFVLTSIIEKLEGINTDKISNTISVLEKIIDFSDDKSSSDTANFYKQQIEESMSSLLTGVNTLMTSDNIALFSFMLDRSLYKQEVFDGLFSSGDITKSTADELKDFSTELEEQYEKYRDGGTKKKWSSLESMAKQHNRIVLEYNASDKHAFSDTEYLRTNKINQQEYLDVINEFKSSLPSNISDLEYNIYIYALVQLLTDRGPDIITYDPEAIRLNNATKHVAKNYGAYGLWDTYNDDGAFKYRADQGVGDSPTDVIEIQIDSVDGLADEFSKVFVNGEEKTQEQTDPDEDNYFISIFKHSSPLDHYLNDAVSGVFPIYLAMKALAELSNRCKLLRDFLAEIDNVDAESIGKAFGGDFIGILNNGDINIALSVKEYYDLLQPVDYPLILKRFQPLSSKEEVALNALFKEEELLQDNIDEQIKIFSLGLTRESIGTVYAPKHITVKIEKQDTLYPDITFEPYIFDIDILNFPVFNGYSFFSTKIIEEELSETLLDTGKISQTSFNSFKEFVKNGMHFLNFDDINESTSEKTIEPMTFDEIINSSFNEDQREDTEIKLLNAAKSKVLGIYLKSLLGTEFKGNDFGHSLTNTDDDETTWYDENALENIKKITTLHDSETEIGKRYKDIMLFNSTILNNKKTVSDVVGLHDILYTYHIMVNVDEDFPIKNNPYINYKTSKALRQYKFDVTSSFVSSIQSTIEEDVYAGDYAGEDDQ